MPIASRTPAENKSGMRAMSPHAHILSVDVEDYFQVEAFAGEVSRDTWDQWPSRVVPNTQRLLDLFEQHQAKATFFFLGWVADRYPGLVREVVSRGHEPACHSYWHRTVYSLTPREFREDTRAAVQAIEDASGVRVAGYRAPTWSITKNCLWALDILAEEGFIYDSSIYPIRHDLYGFPGAQRFPYAHMCAGGRKLREYPPATIQRAGVTLPAAGGGYLRIFPLFLTLQAFREFEEKYRQPLVVYLHPWEVDPEQPRIGGKIRSRLRHYTNLHRMEDRLTVLLQRYNFQSFRDRIETEPADSFECNSPVSCGPVLLSVPARVGVHSSVQSSGEKGRRDDLASSPKEAYRSRSVRNGGALALTYHAIDPHSASSPYTLTSERFEEHLKVVTEYCQSVDGPNNRLQVTFDDGHASNYGFGLPLLERHSVPGIFFVIASFMNSRADFMTWAQLREMAAQGHEIQSHSWSHPLLTHCSDEALKEELERSRQMIEQQVGMPVDALAVPGGRWDLRVLRAAAQAGYRRVYISDPRVAPQQRDGVKLFGRLTVRNSIQPTDLQSLITGKGTYAAVFWAQYRVKELLRRLVGDSVYTRAWSRFAGSQTTRHSDIGEISPRKG